MDAVQVDSMVAQIYAARVLMVICKRWGNTTKQLPAC